MNTLVNACMISSAIAVGLERIAIAGRLRRNQKRRRRHQWQLDRPKQNTQPWAPKILPYLVVLLLGHFLYFRAHSAWTNYWVLRDGLQGMAVIVDESGHKTVIYRYTVNQREYTGHSIRPWQDEKYRQAWIGDEAPVYFSSSHPWLSLLNKPGSVFVALPVVLVVLFVEVMVIFTILRPRSTWALNLIGRDGNAAANGKG